MFSDFVGAIGTANKLGSELDPEAGGESLAHKCDNVLLRVRITISAERTHDETGVSLWEELLVAFE